MLTTVGCGHRSEAGARKKHVWKHVEPPHPKPAPPASVMLNLLSGWPQPHWQSGIRTAGNKKKEGQKERSFQCHKTPQLGKWSCAGAAFRSLSHKPGLHNTEHCVSAEQSCSLAAETSQHLCSIPSAGQRFLLRNGALPPYQKTTQLSMQTYPISDHVW